MTAPVLLALLAALLFAAGNNVQRHVAAEVPHEGVGPLRLFLTLLRSRRWLLGGGFATVALLVQVKALSLGGVILVQAVIASSLVFSLAIEALAERRRPKTVQTIGAACVGLGITAVVGIGQPGAGGAFDSLWRALPAWLAVAVVGGGALFVARRRPKGRITAITLGAAAGTCFVLDAVFLRGLSGSLSPFDTVSVGTNAAGFLVASLLGNMIIQRAFQIAPLRHVLPAMAATEPMAAFACGRLIFGEHLRTGPTGVLGVTGGLILMVIGVVLCAMQATAAPVRQTAAVG